MLSARNAGESTICPVELEAENWRPCSTNVVRGVSGKLEAENWRPCSTTLVRGVSGELEKNLCPQQLRRRTASEHKANRSLVPDTKATAIQLFPV